MDKRELDQTLYRSTFEKLHAPDALSKKVKSLKADAKPVKKHAALRRIAWAAAAAVVLFALSNAVVFAATGQPWVGRIFDRETDTDPNRPHDNIREFFFENDALFDAPRGAAKENYYGGTYLDGGEQVILLTDISRSGEFRVPGQNIRFEQCTYTYAELSRAIRDITAKLAVLRRQGDSYAADVVGMGINDKENRIGVDVYYLTDEKEQWFKENISGAAYLVFYDTHTLPEND